MTLEKHTIEAALQSANATIAQGSDEPINWEGQSRAKRNHLLKISDWTQVADCSLSDEKKEEWRVYRQALRDISTQESWPVYPVWPEAPSA